MSSDSEDVANWSQEQFRQFDVEIAKLLGKDVRYGPYHSPVCFDSWLVWEDWYVPATKQDFEDVWGHNFDSPTVHPGIPVPPYSSVIDVALRLAADLGMSDKYAVVRVGTGPECLFRHDPDAHELGESLGYAPHGCVALCRDVVAELQRRSVKATQPHDEPSPAGPACPERP